MPGLRARSPLGGMREATDGCISRTMFFLFPPPLPASLKLNKQNLLKKKEKQKNEGLQRREKWSSLTAPCRGRGSRGSSATPLLGARLAWAPVDRALLRVQDGPGRWGDPPQATDMGAGPRGTRRPPGTVSERVQSPLRKRGVGSGSNSAPNRH